MAIIPKTGKNKISYKVMVRDCSKKVITKTFGRKIDAESWELEQKNKWLKPKTAKKEILRIRLKDLTLRWLEEIVKVNNEFSTYKRYELDMRLYVLPYIGELFVDELNFEIINNLKMVLTNRKIHGGKLLAPKSINAALGTLSKLLSDAVRWGYIEHNPTRQVQRVKTKKPMFRYLSEDEIETLLNYCYSNKIREKWFYHAALLTGMRLGELVALKKDRIFISKGILVINRIYCSKELVIKENTSKTGEMRTLPIGFELEKVLIDSMNSCPQSEFVFSDPRGKMINFKGISSWRFKRILRKAGIKPAHFHCLRHTYATMFMSSGGNIYDLKELLGHSDVKMTHRYAHFSPQHLRDCANIVSYKFNTNLPKDNLIKIASGK